MKRYFLDTNAVVKRYHQEDGSDVIDRIFAEPEVSLVISDISIIEFFSALTLKIRTGELQEDGFLLARKLFAQELKQGIYQVIRFQEREKVTAAKLLLKYEKQHSLKTLDAFQLALMKSYGQKETIVICADAKFNQTIRREGFQVLDPMRPHAL